MQGRRTHGWARPCGSTTMVDPSAPAPVQSVPYQTRQVGGGLYAWGIDTESGFVRRTAGRRANDASARRRRCSRATQNRDRFTATSGPTRTARCRPASAAKPGLGVTRVQIEQADRAELRVVVVRIQRRAQIHAEDAGTTFDRARRVRTDNLLPLAMWRRTGRLRETSTLEHHHRRARFSRHTR
jgi:hypothetical protein